MIGGGKWTDQQKILNGVYIHFTSDDSEINPQNTPNKPNTPAVPSAKFQILLDRDGVLLKTVDELYLAVDISYTEVKNARRVYFKTSSN